MTCAMVLASIFAVGFDATVLVDRMAVIVGKRVIKTSDIDRDLRLTEFLNREAPNFSPDAKRKAAERLIDQAIIRQDIETGSYARPAEAEAGALLNQLQRDRFSGSAQQLRSALTARSITEDQLRAQLLWQLTVIRFIDQRFRPGVLVSDDEVRHYYDEHLAELKRQYPRNNSFDAIAPRIRASLEGEQINQNFTRWLDQARKTTRIEYREAAFQ